MMADLVGQNGRDVASIFSRTAQPQRSRQMAAQV
jgi:hypothetical protein